MKTRIKLPTILYKLFSFSYRLSIAAISLLLIMDLISGFDSSIEYDVPAYITYNIPGKNINEENIYLSKFTNYKDGKVITEDYEKPDDRESTLLMRGEINIKPKNIFHKTILIVKYYLLFILGIFITWHIREFFKKLSIDFKFSPKHKKHLNTIAYSIMSFELLKFIVSLINKAYISNIKSIIYVPSIRDSNYTLLNFKITYDINLLPFFLGAIIICISKLLEYGQQLQEENDLTV
ncbi:DUF2975 domain-containing protein [Flavobacterium beibuense]|uniref:DUF2975 domain-containing protein n=1 Tax=Flavobacterium beibuense TaxID=657326 RepID=UPI003A8DCEF3